ncbi:MAG TPA: glycosyltransferase [Spirochaetia bacterium]|nr:glycosyltransferase [Spirochaetia bacterium]
MIPKLIHQTAKTSVPDPSWAPYQEAVIRLHPGWTYRLWTDADNVALLKERRPELEPVYHGMPQPAMRADLMRYIYMQEFGGLYLDLDYQFLKEFDLDDREVVLPRESNDDLPIYLGNCVFASAPGHPFWNELLESIRRSPPTRWNVHTENDSTQSAGPGKVTRVWREQFSSDSSIFVPPRLWFNPPRPESPEELEKVKAQAESYGIHWCFGSWRDWNLRAKVRNRVKKLMGR